LEIARKGVRPADGAEEAGCFLWLCGVGHENLPEGSKTRDDGETERSRGKFPLTWWDEDKKFLFEEKSEREPGESSGRREKEGKRKGVRADALGR